MKNPWGFSGDKCPACGLPNWACAALTYGFPAIVYLCVGLGLLALWHSWGKPY